MRFTIGAGDSLWVSSIPFAALQVGDVVVFDSGGQVVAHRIVGLHPQGFLTRGDGNLRRDAAPLTPDRFIGKVLEREQGGVRSSVVGGAQGRRRAVALRAVGFLRMAVLVLLAPGYRALRSSHWVGRAWHPQIVSVRLNYPAGSVTKYIHQGRTVACWMPHVHRWTCRKPFDLVLFPPNP